MGSRDYRCTNRTTDHCLIKLELHQATGVKADIHKEQPGPTRKPKVEYPSNNTTEEEPRPPCNTDQARRYPAREQRAPVKLNL